MKVGTVDASHSVNAVVRCTNGRHAVVEYDIGLGQSVTAKVFMHNA